MNDLGRIDEKDLMKIRYILKNILMSVEHELIDRGEIKDRERYTYCSDEIKEWRSTGIAPKGVRGEALPNKDHFEQGRNDLFVALRQWEATMIKAGFLPYTLRFALTDTELGAISQIMRSFGVAYNVDTRKSKVTLLY